MTRRLRSRARSGFLLVQYFAVVAAVSVFIAIIANLHLAAMGMDRNAYRDSCALALAHSGIEAALASIHRGTTPEQHPLGDQVTLTEATGSLAVTYEDFEDQIELLSCATIEGTRARPSDRPVTRCVEVTAVSGPSPRILSWNEPGSH